MFNVRHKSEPKTIFRVVDFRPNLCRVEYLEKYYQILDKPIVVCKQIGKSSREEFLNLENLSIKPEDNPGLTPIRCLSGYRYQIAGGSLLLYHCLLVTSQNNDGTGYDLVTRRTDMGKFTSVDVLKDFCKKHNLKLINNL